MPNPTRTPVQRIIVRAARVAFSSSVVAEAVVVVLVVFVFGLEVAKNWHSQAVLLLTYSLSTPQMMMTKRRKSWKM